MSTIPGMTMQPQHTANMNMNPHMPSSTMTPNQTMHNTQNLHNQSMLNPNIPPTMPPMNTVLPNMNPNMQPNMNSNLPPNMLPNMNPMNSMGIQSSHPLHLSSTMLPSLPPMSPAPPAMGSAMGSETSLIGAVDMKKHPSGIIPTLQNIVSTVNMGTTLDLKNIALHARNAEYNPKRFAAVIMRIREPKTTALIFASGKMVCTGAKSEELSRLAARKYARIIQKLGFNAKFTDFKIQNIVGSCDVKFPIRLEGLAFAHNNYSSYEPELFPGLIYRMVQPKIVLLIFVSGKIVLTGAKVRDEIYEAFENIYPVLTEYKKT